MKNASIAIFASGNGTNAGQIIKYFKEDKNINISAVFTNKANAGVINIANDMQVQVVIFSREDFYSQGSILNELQKRGITHIVLAGFLWLMPAELILGFNEKIINIHPALLPKYGGKGMYGRFVHEAVKKAREKETGITIHLVNENYDEGKYLLQEKISLTGEETAEQIALKVQELEHEHFSAAIKKWINESY